MGVPLEFPCWRCRGKGIVSELRFLAWHHEPCPQCQPEQNLVVSRLRDSGRIYAFKSDIEEFVERKDLQCRFIQLSLAGKGDDEVFDVYDRLTERRTYTGLLTDYESRCIARIWNEAYTDGADNPMEHHREYLT